MLDLVPLLIQAGVIGALVTAIATTFGALHRSAVAAHKARADDWRAAYEFERAANMETTRQLATLLAPVRDAAAGAV